MRTRKLDAGVTISSLSPSRKTWVSVGIQRSRASGSGARPTTSIASAKTFALPSSTGISGPSTAIRALSTPPPSSALSRCSTVETRCSPRPSTVARTVSTT